MPRWGARAQENRLPSPGGRNTKLRQVLRAIFSTTLAGWLSASFAAGIPTANVRPLFDITGQGAGGLSLPSDVALGSDDRIYVVDGGNQRVVVFDRNGKYLLSFGRKGSAEGQFKDPVGIGTDGKGRVYVADTGNHRIQVFSAEGHFQYAFPVIDKGLAARPIDVAADASGAKIYVSANNKVMRFSGSGKMLRQWGGFGEGNGRFRYPATVAMASNGTVYVVDVLNSRVQAFDEEGALLVQIGSWGVLPGEFFRPKGVAVDEKNQVYISDSYMDVIQVFDADGKFLRVLGQDGAPQRFVSVGGIAVGRDNRLYAAEMLRNKISVYKLND